MVQLIDGGKISGKIAKEILPELLEGGSPKAIVDERGLGMISDPAAIEAIVDELLGAIPMEAFRGGKTKLGLLRRTVDEEDRWQSGSQAGQSNSEQAQGGDERAAAIPDAWKEWLLQNRDRGCDLKG